MVLTVDYDLKKQKGLILQADALAVIREFLSVENPAAKFASKFSRFMPKRLYAITPTGLFDIGLISEIQKIIAIQQLPITVNLTEIASRVYNPTVRGECANEFTKELRDYQDEAVSRCLKQGRGVVVMGTGAGKTLTIASLIQSFASTKSNFKCLIVVPDLGLVRQTYDDFVEYNFKLSTTRWTGSNKPNLDASVFIANTAILQSQFESNEWLLDVDLVVVDETHKLTSASIISKIIQKIKTVHKFGFTGTLPEQKIDKWNVIGKIGPVLYEKSSFELRSENFLSNASVSIINISYKSKPDKIVEKAFATEQYKEELNFLEKHPFRNKIIKTTCSNFNNNILILVNHIEHGVELFDILSSLGDKRVFFIRGEVEVDEREEIKKIMENHNNVICVAISSIFSTGVNVRNIHMIVFAAGGKSFIRIVQSIGRGLRQHQEKDKLIIIDIADNLEYGKKHSQKRKEIYRNEKIQYKETIITEK